MLKIKSLLIIIKMASVNDFNSRISGLKGRGDYSDSMDKAVSDRMNMLKSLEPDVGAQKTQETEVKGTEAVGALKTISDVKDASQKIQKGYGAIKGGAQAVSNMVQGKGVSTNAPVKADPIKDDNAPKLDDATLPRGNPSGATSHLESAVSGNEPAFKGLNLGDGDTKDLFNFSDTAGRSRDVANGIQSSTKVNPMNVSNALTQGDKDMANVSDSLKGAGNLLKNSTGDLASTSTNIHSAVSAGAKVAEEGAEVGAKALAGASAVADALGPVGDLIGLGMAVYGGIKSKSYFKRQQDANTTAQQAVATPAKSSATPTTNVSLDTSKMGQSMGQSHY